MLKLLKFYRLKVIESKYFTRLCAFQNWVFLEKNTHDMVMLFVYGNIKQFISTFTVETYPSQDNLIGSISAWYRGGPWFKTRQEREFFSENK